jgi:hypothetical protein
VIPPPVHLPPFRPGEGLQPGVIILEPGGLVEIIPGDEPGPPIVINEQHWKATASEDID